MIALRWYDRSPLLVRHGMHRHLMDWWAEAMAAGDYHMAMRLAEAMDCLKQPSRA